MKTSVTIRNDVDLNEENSAAEFLIPKDQSKGYINNQKEKYVFKFDQLFGMEARQ